MNAGIGKTRTHSIRGYFGKENKVTFHFISDTCERLTCKLLDQIVGDYGEMIETGECGEAVEMKIKDYFVKGYLLGIGTLHVDAVTLAA